MEQSLQKKQTTSLDKFRGLLDQDSIRKRFRDALGDQSGMFISNLITMVSQTPQLQQCDHMSIISSSMMAASLKLPLTPSLGFASVSPYKSGGGYKASFQIQKKGFIQLGMRTGQFKLLNATCVYEGELVEHNRFTGEMIFDQHAKVSDKIIGYVAYFKLMNGFEKYYYMTIDEIKKHAMKYSSSYKKGVGKWAEDFAVMAEKTVIKLLLSNYAPLSSEQQLQDAIRFDQSEVKDENPDYFDNDHSETPTNKEVYNLDNGASVVIDEVTQQKSQQITSQAAEKIKQKTAPIEDVEEEKTQGPGYNKEQLEKMKLTQLKEICQGDEDMKKAMDVFPKDTKEKHIWIIEKYQEGTLKNEIVKFLDKQVKEGKLDLKEEATEEEIKLNGDFDKEKGNKFGIEIPGFDEGTDYRKADKPLYELYNALKDKAELDNKTFSEMQEKHPDYKKFKNREDFCAKATVEEINTLLSYL
jgi:recombination protein RecT